MNKFELPKMDPSNMAFVVRNVSDQDLGFKASPDSKAVGP